MDGVTLFLAGIALPAVAVLAGWALHEHGRLDERIRRLDIARRGKEGGEGAAAA